MQRFLRFDLGTTNTGIQTSNGALTTGIITPITSNGIVLHVNAIDFHTEANMSSPAGGTFDTIVNDLDDNDPPGGGTDVSTLDMDNDYVHFYNPTTSQVSFTFTATFTPGGTQGVLHWAGATAAFKSATATATPTPIPSPIPTATPTNCIVPNFLGQKINRAQTIWRNAGFTTQVIVQAGRGQKISR